MRADANDRATPWGGRSASSIWRFARVSVAPAQSPHGAGRLRIRGSCIATTQDPVGRAGLSR